MLVRKHAFCIKSSCADALLQAHAVVLAMHLPYDIHKIEKRLNRTDTRKDLQDQTHPSSKRQLADAKHTHPKY